jgi:hypothetical protein
MNNSDEQESIAEINKLHHELQELTIGAPDRAVRLGARSNSTLSTNSKSYSWSRKQKAPAKKEAKKPHGK